MHFTFLQLVLVWVHTHFCTLTHFAMSYTEIAMRWRQWRCSGTNHTAQIPSVSPPVNRNGKHAKGNLGAQEKFRSPVISLVNGKCFWKELSPLGHHPGVLCRGSHPTATWEKTQSWLTEISRSWFFKNLFHVCDRNRQLRPTVCGIISLSLLHPSPQTQCDHILGLAELPLSIPSCKQETKVAGENKLCTIK